MLEDELTKNERKEVRKLLGIAWERELANALSELQAQFNRWHAGNLDPFELNDLIHQFHDGMSRDLYKTYAMRPGELELCNAVARKVIDEDELSEGTRKKLIDTILDIRSRYEEQQVKSG